LQLVSPRISTTSCSSEPITNSDGSPAPRSVKDQGSNLLSISGKTNPPPFHSVLLQMYGKNNSLGISGYVLVGTQA